MNIIAMFEERKNLLTSRANASRRWAVRNEHRRRAKETQAYIDRIEACCWSPDRTDPEDTLTHVRALMAEPRHAKSTR